MAVGGCGSLKQDGHQNHVSVRAIDLNGIALQTLRRKTELVVKRDGVCIVFPERQLDAVKPDSPKAERDWIPGKDRRRFWQSLKLRFWSNKRFMSRR